MSVQPATPADPPFVEDGEDIIVTMPPDVTDAPVDEEVPQQAAPAAPETPVAPAEGLEDIQRQLANERTEREKTEERNRVLASEREQFARIAAEHQQRGLSTEEALLETHLTLAQNAVAAAKQEYQAAFEAGDAAKMADAQERIAAAASDKRTMEREKANFLAQKDKRMAQPVPVGDPIDRAIGSVMPALQPWLRDHKQVFRPDGTLKRGAVEAHETALDEGLSEGTPAYFSRLEEILTEKKILQSAAAPVPAAAPAAPKPQGRPPSVAAPVTRTTPGQAGRPAADGSFRLTPKLRALAEASGAPDTISYADWAREYTRMVNAGEMQPIEG